MRPGRRPWTDAETATLTRLRADGKTASEIAAVLGRSVQAVSSKTSDTPRLVAEVAPLPAPSIHICSTRSEFVTATLMGDPPTGRSALDQRLRP
jgi:hypothetical protein